uniref:Cytochrome c biogenesis protein CcsA n=1 Tax=Heliophila pusilla TaxID=302114 RepID=A0A8F2JF75_9BRAS|nr:ribosomal protein L32 [Heliophila pusilla]
MIFSILEHILTHISFSVVSIVLTIYFLTFFINLDEIIGFFDSLDKGIVITSFGITGLLFTRWIYSGHFPLSNLYESFIFLSWAFSILHMVYYFNKKFNKKQKIYLNAITAPSTIFIQGFATSGLLNKMPQSLVPALQSQWLMMHVSMMILGYSALLCGSLLSIALLVLTFPKVGPTFSKKKNFLLTELFELFSFYVLYYIDESNYIFLEDHLNSDFRVSINYCRFQFVEQLEFWSFRIISLGFIFLTVGILSGAVWANETWGSYWNWDPKETWAFITWTIFAIYLHIRKNGPGRGRGINSAIVASIGFLLIWICYFGVNLLGIGLHSYGSFTSN